MVSWEVLQDLWIRCLNNMLPVGVLYAKIEGGAVALQDLHKTNNPQCLWLK
mgnify:CR=1 FL=1